MIACAGCGTTDKLKTVENHDPVSGNVTGLVYTCPGCLSELAGREGHIILKGETRREKVSCRRQR